MTDNLCVIQKANTIKMSVNRCMSCSLIEGIPWPAFGQDMWGRDRTIFQSDCSRMHKAVSYRGLPTEWQNDIDCMECSGEDSFCGCSDTTRRLWLCTQVRKERWKYKTAHLFQEPQIMEQALSASGTPFYVCWRADLTDAGRRQAKCSGNIPPSWKSTSNKR